MAEQVINAVNAKRRLVKIVSVVSGVTMNGKKVEWQQRNSIGTLSCGVRVGDLVTGWKTLQRWSGHLQEQVLSERRLRVHGSSPKLGGQESNTRTSLSIDIDPPKLLMVWKANCQEF